MTASPRPSAEDLLKRSYYTPDELAQLVEMPVTFVREEALLGRLNAIIIDHHVVSIRRQDAIEWITRLTS